MKAFHFRSKFYSYFYCKSKNNVNKLEKKNFVNQQIHL